jgi:uncharacterized protein DUF1552
MFLTKRHLQRRTFLKAAGASLALPLLDAMIPAATALAKTAAAPRPRLGFIYFPHGAVMENWTPTSTSADFALSPILQPLAALRSHLSVVSNIGNKPGESRAVHALVPGTWLSCVHPTEGPTPNGGVTADQIAAARIGQETQWPSLEIATAQGHGAGSACERGYGCSYTSTLSFRTPSTPLPIESNPRELFLRLFGQGDSAEERKFLAQQTGSLLDMVSSEVSSLRRELGPQDQQVLANYLDSVREIERRTQMSAQGDLSHLQLPDTPGANSESFDEHINLLFDLTALALQGNLTRVFTFMMAPEVSEQTYGHIGVPDAFHALSHHANEKAKKDRLTLIQAYHTKVFAKFATKLQQLPDGDGNMLDNSLLLYGSNMSNSNAHNQYPLPTAVLGRAGGRVKGNQHINYPERTPLANVLRTMLDRSGVPVDKFGDSTGLVTQL